MEACQLHLVNLNCSHSHHKSIIFSPHTQGIDPVKELSPCMGLSTPQESGEHKKQQCMVLSLTETKVRPQSTLYSHYEGNDGILGMVSG